MVCTKNTPVYCLEGGGQISCGFDVINSCSRVAIFHVTPFKANIPFFRLICFSSQFFSLFLIFLFFQFFQFFKIFLFFQVFFNKIFLFFQFFQFFFNFSFFLPVFFIEFFFIFSILFSFFNSSLSFHFFHHSSSHLSSISHTTCFVLFMPSFSFATRSNNNSHRMLFTNMMISRFPLFAIFVFFFFQNLHCFY